MNKIELNNLYGDKVNIEIVDNIEDANFITHNGTFHADEVMSLCILINVFGTDIKLFRTTKLDKIDEAFIFDMGGGPFDHHGKDFNKMRENGVKYASCGLIWKEFGKTILSNLGVRDIDNAFDYIDNDLICDIDRYDNGQTITIDAPYSVKNVSDLIDLFNPDFDESDNEKEYFLKAVLFANIIFSKEMKKCLSLEKSKVIIDKKINESTDDFIELDYPMDWKNLVLSSSEEKANNIKYAILPSNRGGYNVVATPLRKDSFELRKPLPSSWGGKSKEELFELTGIDTLYFCHKNLFLCACDTREDALKIVNLALLNKEYDSESNKQFIKKP